MRRSSQNVFLTATTICQRKCLSKPLGASIEHGPVVAVVLDDFYTY